MVRFELRKTTHGTPVAVSNDILGNRVSQGDAYTQNSSFATYQWDNVNRLKKQVTSETGGAHYIYRSDGMRVEKVTDCSLTWYYDEINDSSFYDEETSVDKPTTRYYYDGQMCAEEDYTEDAAYGDPVYDITLYGLGARGIDYIHVIPWDDDEEVKFPLYDGHGNMIATLSRASSSPYFSIADERGFDVWGSVRLGSGETSQSFCANIGHTTDNESGLVYMRARYYEPWTGRFVSEDRAMDGWNWFTYCKNDPCNAFDPSGRFHVKDQLFDLWMGLGACSFGFGAMIMLSPLPLTPEERTIAYGLIAASAAAFGQAFGFTDLGSPKFVQFLQVSTWILAISALIAEGIHATKSNGFAAIATLALAAESTIILGLIIGNEFEGYE